MNPRRLKPRSLAQVTLALWIMNVPADAGEWASTSSGIVSYKGDVVDEDVDTLRGILDRMRARGVTPRLLSIDYSGGGSTSASMTMALIVRREKLDTEVYGRCSSACVTVYAGGVNKRLIKPLGSLNVHSARDGETSPGPGAGENQLSRANTTRLGRFFFQMGAPYGVVGKLVATPPSMITPLDDDDLREWGVDIR